MNNGIIDFGKALLDLGDLDPVYNYLAEANLEPNQLKRWLMAYSMFYHVGVANHLSRSEWTTKDSYFFWSEVMVGYYSFPRGEERRHFRGMAGENAIHILSEAKPEEIVDYWYKDNDFQSVITRVKSFPLYGPWIAFKMADMGERVLRLPIDFSTCSLNVYKEPRIGASIALYGLDREANSLELDMAVNFILRNLKEYKAPPWEDRPLNIQEAETILCKYKSFKHGHYYPGKDVEAVKKALGWSS